VVDDAYDTVSTQSEPNAVPSDWVLRNHGCIFQMPVAPTASPASSAREYGAVRGANLRRLRRNRGNWGSSGSLSGGHSSDGSSESSGGSGGVVTGGAGGGDPVADLLFSPQLRTLVETLLGGPAWLYNEQYIVKPPSCDGAKFQWHRDSDSCKPGVEQRPYLSMWCALDDVHEDNGTLFIQPYPQTSPPPAHSGLLTEDLIHRTAGAAYPHVSQLTANDGRPVIVPAGAVVVMSDRVLHCSGGNMSGKPRRAWMPQFSLGPVYHHSVCDASKTTRIVPAALAVPLTDAAQEMED